MKPFGWKLLAVAAALCLLTFVALDAFRDPSEALPSAETFDLTILHTNDLHAHYEPVEPWGEPVQGGVARLATAIDDVREVVGHSLLLDAGDQFQGTLYFHVGGAKAVAEVMNTLEYDAMVIGNHEFDSGPSELAALIDLAGFPVLSANIDASSDPDLAGLIEPFTVFEFDEEEVAVFGLTTEEAAVLSSPGPLVRLEDISSAARATVAAIEALGINKIIALTHVGLPVDLVLATAVAGIDVIVGGHSHSLIGDGASSQRPYPLVELSPRAEPVYVVTAYEWGKRLGRLDVTFDEAGVVTKASGEPLFIGESLAEDERVVGLLDGYTAAIDALKTQVVGSAENRLDGEEAAVRSTETNLGNLVCDAVLWRTTAFGAQVVIQNGGGIRASVPMGEVTMGQVLEVLPYGNEITVLELTGAQVVAALENGVSQVEEGAGRFPQVAGLRFRFSADAPSGERVECVEVRARDSNEFLPIDPDTTYTLATNEYLADGGDGYDALGEAASRYDTGLLLSDVFAEYLQAVATVAPQIEGRITLSEAKE
jgi:5'-nucleotidase/UDP-sugar diphosphatase